MEKKKLKDILVADLYSSDEATILKALEELSQKGHSQYLPIVFELLSTHESSQIHTKIITILSEIKHTNAVPHIVEAIENEKYSNIQETLVRICWENGLNYANYLSTFVDLLIKGNYMIALEAFTVIENTEDLISSTSAQELINRLNIALQDTTPDRKSLIQPIIEFLPGITKA